MLKIKFAKFSKLKKLDLSKNNLSRIEMDSFSNLKILEYLDLSFNKIEFIDEKIFSTILNVNYLNYKFQYLNLENNRIKSVGLTFLDYMYLTILKLSNNENSIVLCC